MTYFMPQEHECRKCGHTADFGEGDFPLTLGGDCFCPACLHRFLKEYVGTMRLTEAAAKRLGVEFKP